MMRTGSWKTPAMAGLALVAMGTVAAGATPGTATLSVSVVDPSGRIVDDLQAGELTLREKGQSRAIAGVKRDERPLAVAVLVDTSAGVTASEIAEEADAVAPFLASLPPGTASSVLAIGTPPQWIEGDATAAAARLRARVPFSGLSLYDGLAEASRRLAAQDARRRAIVVVTSSAYPERDWPEAFRALGPAAPIVLAVHVDARARYGEGLDAVVRWSGGRYETVGAASGLRAALARLRPELDAPWIVTYQTPAAAPMHEVDIRAARPGARVRFRPAGLD